MRVRGIFCCKPFALNQLGNRLNETQAHEERLCPSCAEVMGTGQEVQKEPDKGLQPASSSFTPSWSEAPTELQHAVVLIAVAKLAIHTMKLVG